MSKQIIVEKILADAQAEAEAIIAEAEQKAKAIEQEAIDTANEKAAQTEQEVSLLVKDILERRAAAARLDGAKMQLAQRRRGIDQLYKKALEALCALSEEQAIALYSNLLEQYAEEGDSVVFAENCKYVKQIAATAVFNKKGLKVSTNVAKIAGGFLLVGAKCDKDVSFEALLAADRDEYQSELAKTLYK